MKILQIIPAQGWCAVDLVQEPPWFFVTALACFALVQEDDGEIHVSPFYSFDQYIDDCDESGSFHEVIHERDITDAKKEGWIEYAKNLAKRP